MEHASPVKDFSELENEILEKFVPEEELVKSLDEEGGKLEESSEKHTRYLALKVLITARLSVQAQTHKWIEQSKTEEFDLGSANTVHVLLDELILSLTSSEAGKWYKTQVASTIHKTCRVQAYLEEANKLMKQILGMQGQDFAPTSGMLGTLKGKKSALIHLQRQTQTEPAIALLGRKIEVVDNMLTIATTKILNAATLLASLIRGAFDEEASPEIKRQIGPYEVLYKADPSSMEAQIYRGELQAQGIEVRLALTGTISNLTIKDITYFDQDACQDSVEHENESPDEHGGDK